MTSHSETDTEAMAHQLKALASLTPHEALVKAAEGKLTVAEAGEMGAVASAYIVAGMRHVGGTSKISAQNLLRVCFDVIHTNGLPELERLQWVEGKLAEMVREWDQPTSEALANTLDRGLQRAAGELLEMLDASNLDHREPLPQRTVLVLAIGHEMDSDQMAARIQRAVAMAVNHPGWIDDMTAGD